MQSFKCLQICKPGKKIKLLLWVPLSKKNIFPFFNLLFYIFQNVMGYLKRTSRYPMIQAPMKPTVKDHVIFIMEKQS